MLFTLIVGGAVLVAALIMIPVLGIEITIGGQGGQDADVAETADTRQGGGIEAGGQEISTDTGLDGIRSIQQDAEDRINSIQQEADDRVQDIQQTAEDSVQDIQQTAEDSLQGLQDGIGGILDGFGLQGLLGGDAGSEQGDVGQ